MKLFIIGEFFPGSIEVFYKNAFQSLGVKLHCFNTDRPGKLRRAYWQFLINKKILESVSDFGPDLVLIFKGFYVRPDTILKIKKDHNCLIFCFNGDSPFNPSWGSSNKNISSSIPIYDHYFTFGHQLLEPIKKAGGRGVEVLAFGFDPAVHRPLELLAEERKVYANDLTFIGSWDREREYWLKNLIDFDLGIWGSGYWRSRCKDRQLRKKWKGKETFSHDQTVVLNAAKISLNILRIQNKNSHNMRTFEVPACGTFVLSESSPEIEEFFKKDEEIVFFSTPQELKDKALYYLKHQKERERIAGAGYKRCISSGYSYADRAKVILKTFERLSSKLFLKNMTKKYKLAIVATYIIQYAVPLYHKLNNHPRIDPMIYFCSDEGLGKRIDEKFSLKIKWDNVSLEGLRYKFLKNYSPFPNVMNLSGLINFGIIRELRHNHYDAVYVNGYYTISAWLTFLGAYLSKTPLILTGEPPSPWKAPLLKAIGPFLRRIILPRLLDFSSAIFYIGSDARNFFLTYEKYTKGIKNKLFFVPYSVDNDYLFKKAIEYKDRKREIKKEFGIPLDYPVILYLSKLIERKQPMLLLKAFNRIKTDACLVYVGSGEEEGRLRRYIKRNHVKKVFLLGFKNYSETTKCYSIADIFVLPSLGESFGLVINEAMCFGLPIITTDKVSCAHDLVRQGENGYIYPAEDIKALTDALEDMLSNQERLERMGQISRKLISGWGYHRDIAGFLEALNFICKR